MYNYIDNVYFILTTKFKIYLDISRAIVNMDIVGAKRIFRNILTLVFF